MNNSKILNSIEAPPPHSSRAPSVSGRRLVLKNLLAKILDHERTPSLR